MFESDCWLDWDPDPERAARDAEPTLEPYASMSRSQILDLMTKAKGGREWEFLQEFFLNRCTAEELVVGTEEFIQKQYGVFGFEEICFLEEAIELALRHRRSQGADGFGPVEGRLPFVLPERFNPVGPVSVWDKSG